MIVRVICTNCGTVYYRSINKWNEPDQTTTVTTTIVCPSCGNDQYEKIEI